MKQNFIKNVVLDRDGTIISDKHYLSRPEDVELIDGALSGLRSLSEQGVNLYLVTNQSGIGRGYFSEEDYHSVHSCLEKKLAGHDIYFKESLWCPHAPRDLCSCRKPGTGLWERLVEKYDLNPQHTVMVGDKKADIDLGLNCKMLACILVCTGKGEQQAEDYGLPVLTAPFMQLKSKKPYQPHVLAVDIKAACDWIFDHNRAIIENYL